MNGLKSFGRLLRRLRGKTALEMMAQHAELDPADLAQIEAGHRVVDQGVASRILQRGLGLPRKDAHRLILGLHLYDLGLKDNDLRQLVIALIRKELPPTTQDELRHVYRRTIDS